MTANPADPRTALAEALKHGNIGCEAHGQTNGAYHLVADHQEDAAFIATLLAERGVLLVTEQRLTQAIYDAHLTIAFPLAPPRISRAIFAALSAEVEGPEVTE